MKHEITFSHIVAMDVNGIIGIKGSNKLLWDIKEDLKYFKTLTKDKFVIMGRNTYESLPGPLKNRKLIVVTSDLSYESSDLVATSIEDAILLAKLLSKHGDEVFIAGGESIYRQTKDYITKSYITVLYTDLYDSLVKINSRDSISTYISTDYFNLIDYKRSESQYVKDHISGQNLDIAFYELTRVSN